MTSLHYPTYVLANHLRKVCHHFQNCTEAAAHPNNGPFRVEVKNGELHLINSSGRGVVKLPFPKVLDDPSKPWLFYPEFSSENPNETSRDDMDISDPTPPGTPADKLQEEMEVDNEVASTNSKSSVPIRHGTPAAAFRTSATPKKPGVVPKFKSNKKSSQSTLNFKSVPCQASLSPIFLKPPNPLPSHQKKASLHLSLQPQLQSISIRNWKMHPQVQSLHPP
jgi:hypothetical protein